MLLDMAGDLHQSGNLRIAFCLLAAFTGPETRLHGAFNRGEKPQILGFCRTRGAGGLAEYARCDDAIEKLPIEGRISCLYGYSHLLFRWHRHEVTLGSNLTILVELTFWRVSIRLLLRNFKLSDCRFMAP